MIGPNQNIIIVVIISTLLFTGLVAGFILVYLLHHRQKSYDLILEKKEAELELERVAARHQKEKLQKDLEIARSVQELDKYKLQLEYFKKSILSKNKIIEDLKNQPSFCSNSDIINQLKSQNIMTKEDWMSFLALFEHVYEGYTFRLKQKVLNISPAEIKIVVLSKLKFSTQETANMLGVTSQAVRTSWHRLKKKIGGDKKDTLSIFAESI